MLTMKLLRVIWPASYAKKCIVIVSCIGVAATSAMFILYTDVSLPKVKPVKHQIDAGGGADKNWNALQDKPLSSSSTQKVQHHLAELRREQSTEKPTLLHTFRTLLDAQDYEAAVNRYDQIYTDSSIAVSSHYRELILDHASDLIQDDYAVQAISLLNQYLAIYYSDVSALIMLGQAYRETGSKFEAIQSLQQAYQHEHRTGLSELILGNANTVLGEYIQELKETDNQQTILEVYQWLTQAQPDVSGYFIGLAKAYAAQHRYQEAADALRYVQYDVKVGQQARSLLQELAEKNDS